MLIEARALPADARLDAGVCVIGGGVAGITLALELERKGVASLLLEAGGLSDSGRSHYEGEAIGLAYDLAASRTRQLGGSSNCWWGWCSPFTEMDFRKRPWVPNSGWPIGPSDLADYYPAAAKILQVSALDRETRDTHLAAGAPAFRSGDLRTWISHLSPPTRFGAAYIQSLRTGTRIKVLLNAPVVEVLALDPPGRARAVRIRVDGRDHVLSARAVVLAAGGIENPRLLLLSNAVETAGIGNQHDNVGRYFMDHPRLRVGQVHLNDPSSIRRLYDVRYYYGNPRLAAERVSGSIGLRESAQERDRILQCYSGFLASYVGEETPGVDIAKSVYKAMRIANAPPFPPRSLLSVISALPAATLAYVASLTRATTLVRHFQIQSILEPVPDRENRVTLSEQRDALGLNRPRLIWRVGEMEKRTHLAAIRAIKHGIEGHGLGHVRLDENDIGPDWQNAVLPTNHHIGTTRMSEDPRLGVVDTKCRVHGYSNLFIAGSSVFPTGAGQPPTFTIVALTLRLAEAVIAALH